MSNPFESPEEIARPVKRKPNETRPSQRISRLSFYALIFFIIFMMVDLVAVTLLGTTAAEILK